MRIVLTTALFGGGVRGMVTASLALRPDTRLVPPRACRPSRTRGPRCAPARRVDPFYQVALFRRPRRALSSRMLRVSLAGSMVQLAALGSPSRRIRCRGWVALQPPAHPTRSDYPLLQSNDEMQDRYVGDIGDFGKYALLNALAGDELRLGVHWYLNRGEEDNADGRFTDYKELRGCDPTLYEALQDIVRSGRRSVCEVERAGILPSGTVFFSLPLSSPDPWDRTAQRRAWNARALETLAGADLIFMDPDNGLSTKPTALLGAKGAKYVSVEELVPYVRRGKSVVIYHHADRHQGGLAATVPTILALLRSLGSEAAPLAFVFRRVSARVYFIVPAKAHADILVRRCLQFLDTPWVANGHFEIRLP